MTRVQHLLDVFDRYVRGAWTAVRYDDGLRQWSYSADALRAAAEAFARRLDEAGLAPGDRLVIWSENRPEWLAAFWGAMLRGVAVVPLDERASAAVVRHALAAAAPRGLVAGERVDVAGVPPSVRVWRRHDIAWTASGSPPARAAVSAATTAEIVFTSGTTGEPKGVVITHGNIVANITPIERTAARYLRYLWPLRPLRFLGLLPLSHMFGQALTVFLPPLVQATTVFVTGYGPQDVLGHIRRHRITLAVTVPRVLDLLRTRVRQLAPTSLEPTPPGLSLGRRLWRHRDVHRLFGWRFCGFVVGGAHLDPDLESFWRRLALVVAQGYGLTETAPIVAWNNPFATRHGSVGRPLDGVEVRIAPDGEVLVRGAVVTPGYLDRPEDTRSTFAEGWFHTGDLGTLDASGQLWIHGRKKDVIVTADGVHVAPEDVERGLEAVAGVREAAVVARRNGGERVHAVLVLDPGIEAAAVIRQANAALAPDQRIRDFSLWPGDALPRTEAVGKLKREEIRRWVAGGAGPAPLATPGGGADDLDRILARYAPGHRVSADTALDELGLSSLDRIELTMAIEAEAGVGLSEAAVTAARTVGELRHAVEAAGRPDVTTEALSAPRWARRWWARLVRDVSQPLWILPIAGLFMRRRADGQQWLERLGGPVIFAANHQSHLDTPAVLASLPGRWRRRVAVAMAKEFFAAHFAPAGFSRRQRAASSALYVLAALLFNGFPLPRSGPGTRAALRQAGELAAAGTSILIFPEGHRTDTGDIAAFQPGVAMMAVKLELPVVPVRLEGLDRVLHHTWRWPRRGPVRVSFGPPLALAGDDYEALAGRVEQAVRALGVSAAPRDTR
ncbi:MAG: AMP-binding protein [Vicinamibacterales bacterium]